MTGGEREVLIVTRTLKTGKVSAAVPGTALLAAVRDTEEEAIDASYEALCLAIKAWRNDGQDLPAQPLVAYGSEWKRHKRLVQIGLL